MMQESDWYASIPGNRPDGLKPLEEREDEDFGFFDYAGDIAAAPFRGIAGAVEGIAEIGNIIPGVDYDIASNLGLGESKTFVGGAIEGITEFGTAFIPVAGWVGRGAKVAKMGKMAGGLEKAAKAKGAKGWAARRGQEAIAGGIADFAVIQGHEARLSDLIEQFPALQNPITEFLQSDEDDSEIVGRLKAAVEGIGAGVVFDSLLLGVKALRKGKGAFDEVITKGGTEEAANKKAAEAIEEVHRESDEAGAKAADKEGLWDTDIDFDSPAHEGEILVYVDPRKLADDHVRTDPQFKDAGDIPPTGGIQNRVDEGKPIYPAEFFHEDTPAGFRNGRHRILWAADQGLDSVPLITSKDSLPNLQKYLVDDTAGSADYGPKDFRHGGEEIVDLIAEAEALVPNPKRKRGSDNIFKRLELETNLTGDREQLQGVRTFMDEMGPEYFDDLGISIHRNLSAKGRMEFGPEIIRIAKRTVENGELEDTMIHELWHKLSQNLPKKDLLAVRKSYQKALDKQPVIKELLEEGSFNQARYDELVAKHGKEKVDAVVKKNGDSYSLSINNRENYRFTDEDEWFAETMREVTQGRLDFLNEAAPSGTVKRIFQDLGVIFRDLWVYTKEKFGFAGPEQRIFNDFLKGKRLKRQRRGGLQGRFTARMADMEPRDEVLKFNEQFDELSREGFEDRDYPLLNTKKFEGDAATYLRATELHSKELFSDESVRLTDAAVIDEARTGVAEFLEMSPKDMDRVFSRAAGNQHEMNKLYLQMDWVIASDIEGRIMPTLREALEGGDADPRLWVSAISDLRLLEAREGWMKNVRTKVSQGLRLFGKGGGGIDPSEIKRPGQKAVGTGAGPGDGPGMGPGAGPGMGPGAGPGMGPGAGPGMGPGAGGAPDTVTRQADEMTERSIEEAGGQKALKKKVEAMVKLYDDVAMKRGQAAARRALANMVKDQKKSPYMGMFNELYMNNALSALTTPVTNIIGPVATSIFNGLEQILGGGIVKGIDRLDGPKSANKLLEEKAVIRQGTNEILGLVKRLALVTETADVARKSAKRSWKESESVLDPGMSQLDLPESQRRAWSASTFDKADDSAAGRMLNILGTVINAPTRVLSTTDDYIKVSNFMARAEAVLTEQAIAQGMSGKEAANWAAQRSHALLVDGAAKTLRNLDAAADKRNLTGKQKIEWINEQIANDDGIDIIGLADESLGVARENTATRALRTDESSFRKFSATIQRTVNQHPTLRPFLMFIRTPVNLLSWAGERTVDPAITLGRLLKERVKGSSTKEAVEKLGALHGNRSRMIADLASEDPVRRAQAHGRAMTGLGLASTAYMMASEGMITGQGPEDHQQRKLLQETGWRPYSLKIGDEYVSYQKLDPFATFFALTGDLHDVARYGGPEMQDGIEDYFLNLGISLGRLSDSKSYLQGLEDFYKLWTDTGTHVPKFTAKVAGNLVPLAGFWKKTTPTLLDDNDARELTTIMDGFKSSLPWAYGGLDKQRNFMGESIEKFGTGSQWTEWWQPIIHSTTSSDPINREVANLRHSFSPPPTNRYGMNLQALKADSGQSAYDRWMELHQEVRIGGRSLNQAMNRLIRSAAYQRMAPDAFGDQKSPRVSAIQSLVSKYRTRAETVLWREFPQVKAARKNKAVIRQAQKTGQTTESIRASLFPLD
jgi:hypothetical protein